MELNSINGKSVLDLFPDLTPEVPKKSKSGLPVPQPPDTSWLVDGILEKKEETGDSLTALVVISKNEKLILVEKILKDMSYTIHIALSAAHAIDRLNSNKYNLIISRSGSAFQDIHQHICGLPSVKRRVIYYAVVGPHLHTLYDLEALALSANLVINDRDLPHLKKILRRGLQDYENLFRTFLDELSLSTSSL